MIRSEKECFKCKAVKPLTEFYTHSRMADGHLNKCKGCAKNDSRKNRGENLERYRAYDRERGKNPDRVKSNSEISKAWKQEDLRRSFAHGKVRRAIKSGDLLKHPCIRCGNSKSVAHHEDYDKPLDVMWLCQPCHKQRHKEMKEEF